MAEKNETADRGLTSTRVFDAPIELVWKVWTDAHHLAQWWGPNGFTNPVCEVDLRPGGAIYIEMQGHDGVIYPMKGVYLEIVKPGRLVFTSAALDKKGNALFQVINTITFARQDGKTKITIHASVSTITPEAKPYLDGMNEGWKQSIDRLNNYLLKILK